MPQIRKVHAEPLSHLVFREDAVVTACRRGQVKVWVRPAAAGSEPATDRAGAATGAGPAGAKAEPPNERSAPQPS